MLTTATQLRRVENIERLPDGVYDGIWGGYMVCFTVDGVDHEAHTRDGIRTLRAPCKVTSKNGSLTVETTDNRTTT